MFKKRILTLIVGIMFVGAFALGFAACNNGGGNESDDQQTFDTISASQLVAGIKIGWNLGNSLDANGTSANATVTQMETNWGNPVTTKANIDAIKNAGFNAIRIPVSWTKAADSNYVIRADWMARVTQIVDYAVANDMYILLNTHHDEDVFKFTDADKTASLAAFKKIWEQIADNFKNYNEKLIFEGLNEPRTKGSAAEWSGGTAAERAVLNAYYPVFIDVVRKSGGNNSKRILQINTYAASAEQAAIDGLTIPADTVANKIIVSIHAYTPNGFAFSSSTTAWSKDNYSDTNSINTVVDRAYNKFVSKGIPVIIGEFGAVNKNNEAARAAWAEYYVGYARSKGIPSFFWDNGVSSTSDNEPFEILNRTNNTITFPDLLAGLMKGANSTAAPGGDKPAPPTTITGNVGNYTFGMEEDNVTPNYQVAVWTLSSANVTLAKTAGTKLVLKLTNAPSSSMDFVWQGGTNYWEDKQILGNTGNPANSSVTWNTGTKTLTITLNADTIKNYASTFSAQTSLKLIIGYWNGGSVNDLGITSANLE